jgi:hypothetical protein
MGYCSDPEHKGDPKKPVPIHGHGLCGTCHQRWYARAQREAENAAPGTPRPDLSQRKYLRDLGDLREGFIKVLKIFRKMDLIPMVMEEAAMTTIINQCETAVSVVGKLLTNEPEPTEPEPTKSEPAPESESVTPEVIADPEIQKEIAAEIPPVVPAPTAKKKAKTIVGTRNPVTGNIITEEQAKAHRIKPVVTINLKKEAQVVIAQQVRNSLKKSAPAADRIKALNLLQDEDDGGLYVRFADNSRFKLSDAMRKRFCYELEVIAGNIIPNGSKADGKLTNEPTPEPPAPTAKVQAKASRKTHARNPNPKQNTKRDSDSGTFCSCSADHPDVTLSDTPTCKKCAAGLRKLKNQRRDSETIDA